MNDEPTNLPALPTTPFEMLSRAVAQGADPATLERLLAMYERYEANEARKAYKKAIAQARGKIKPILKNREGPPGRKQNYEDLAAIERAVVPALSDYGLSYRFTTEINDSKPDVIEVTCYVEHKDGHSEHASLSGQPDTSGSKSPIQAIGSTVTYLKRITLKAALGLSATDQDVDEDDDGAGGAQEPISEMELAMLRKKIEQVGQTEERVCTHYKIDKLENMPASMFDKVLNALKPQQTR